MMSLVSRSFPFFSSLRNLITSSHVFSRLVMSFSRNANDNLDTYPGRQVDRHSGGMITRLIDQSPHGLFLDRSSRVLLYLVMRTAGRDKGSHRCFTEGFSLFRAPGPFLPQILREKRTRKRRLHDTLGCRAYHSSIHACKCGAPAL